jgi:hypothetical protein
VGRFKLLAKRDDLLLQCLIRPGKLFRDLVEQLKRISQLLLGASRLAHVRPYSLIAVNPGFIAYGSRSKEHAYRIFLL